MEKQDYIYTDKNGYKVHIIALVPNKPKRLLLIPPLVGATGVLAIRTFRYFFREGCILMSFDYCGHYSKINNKFTIKGTFDDTEASLCHAYEYAKKANMPVHVVGACYGLIPLIYVLNKMKWSQEVKSMFSVSGLLNINDILNFDNYKSYLEKKGLIFRTKSDFINYMSQEKKEFISNKSKYVEALTECLLQLFAELSGIISNEKFGVLKYSQVEFYKSFYEFMTVELPELVIPERMPSLFFFGTQDKIFDFETEKRKGDYLARIKTIAPHAKLCDIRIDHFGRGEDHYVIGEEGMRFLISNDN